MHSSFFLRFNCSYFFHAHPISIDTPVLYIAQCILPNIQNINPLISLADAKITCAVVDQSLQYGVIYCHLFKYCFSGFLNLVCFKFCEHFMCLIEKRQ